MQNFLVKAWTTYKYSEQLLGDNLYRKYMFLIFPWDLETIKGKLHSCNYCSSSSDVLNWWLRDLRWCFYGNQEPGNKVDFDLKVKVKPSILLYLVIELNTQNCNFSVVFRFDTDTFKTSFIITLAAFSNVKIGITIWKYI